MKVNRMFKRQGLLVCMLFASFAQTQIRAQEFRGLWVDAFGEGFRSTNEIKKLVSDCRKYNFNAVIVQMRRRKNAFYFPKTANPDPRTTALATNFDALATIIAKCRNG